MGKDTKKILLEKLGFLKEEKEQATATNFRCDGEIAERKNSDFTIISSIKDGIKVKIMAGAQNEVVDLPVLLIKNGLKEKVKTEIIVGEGANVTVVSGCGVCNYGKEFSKHEGVHILKIEKNAKLTYLERHYAAGEGEKEINTDTKIIAEENAEVNLKTFQLGGIDKARRKLSMKLAMGAKVLVEERIKTEKNQVAKTVFYSKMKEKNSSLKISSRSVAKGDSCQFFKSEIVGETKCFGHVECDAILAENGRVLANPIVDARHKEAELIHEAAIGKIADDQLLKLLTLGYNKTEAEKIILEGFLNN